MRIQVIFGILWIFTQAAMGLLLQDPVVCRFNESNQCYVALGHRLHLQMPLEDAFNLNIRDETNTTDLIFKYRKAFSNPPKPTLPRWQFVNDNKTMILTSAERSDSGTYTLETFDVNGKTKGNYDLQLNIEAELSSMKVSYTCLSPGVPKVQCSSDGENVHFYWTYDLNTHPQLENGNSTLILEKDHHGEVTCHVENHVSRRHITTDFQPCPVLLIQDLYVCSFTESNQCYVALGHRLHLQMPLEDAFNLNIRDETNTTHLIFKYRKVYSNPPTPTLPRWQFVNDNKIMILTSAERSDSGTYTLETFDENGKNKGDYNLQLNIEDEEAL